MKLFILLGLVGLIVTATAQTWKRTAYFQALWISSGQAGVWGVDSSYGVWYRENTKTAGFLKKIDGSLKQISSGKDQVWGVDKNYQVYYRSGISASNPTGTEWKKIFGRMAQVSVSSFDNALWAVNNNNQVFRRTETSELLGGKGWKPIIPGSLASVSVGKAGVWGVHKNGKVYFRTGTGAYDGNSETGTEWKQVQPTVLFKTISVGDDAVYGTTISNTIKVRMGISSTRPYGTYWKFIPGNLKQISVNANDDTVWGVDTNDKICKLVNN